MCLLSIFWNSFSLFDLLLMISYRLMLCVGLSCVMINKKTIEADRFKKWTRGRVWGLGWTTDIQSCPIFKIRIRGRRRNSAGSSSAKTASNFPPLFDFKLIYQIEEGALILCYRASIYFWFFEGHFVPKILMYNFTSNRPSVPLECGFYLFTH